MAANVLDSIMLFGDSLTQGGWERGGFAQRLAYVYARKLDVINRGLSGYNSEWGLPVFRQCFAKKTESVPQVKLLTIWFGANDACLPQSPQHTPIARFISNVREMIDLVRSPESEYYSPTTRIVLITPPPIHEGTRNADLGSRDPPIAPDREFKNTKNYAEAVIQLANELGNIPVVDMFGLVWDAARHSEDNLPKYLSDGLHLTEAGYTVLFDNLIKTIANDYPELHHDNLPSVYPPWADINFENPKLSLVSRRQPSL